MKVSWLFKVKEVTVNIVATVMSISSEPRFSQPHDGVQLGYQVWVCSGFGVSYPFALLKCMEKHAIIVYLYLVFWHVYVLCLIFFQTLPSAFTLDRHTPGHWFMSCWGWFLIFFYLSICHFSTSLSILTFFLFWFLCFVLVIFFLYLWILVVHHMGGGSWHLGGHCPPPLPMSLSGLNFE